MSGSESPPPRPSVLYRIVKAHPATAEDFRSWASTGRVLRQDATDMERECYEGVSAYESEDVAREWALRLPKMGAFIAEFAVPSGCRVERTFVNSPGHFTVWAAADELLAMVTRYAPVVR